MPSQDGTHHNKKHLSAHDVVRAALAKAAKEDEKKDNVLASQLQALIAIKNLVFLPELVSQC